MNILQRTILEVKIGDRFFNFECSPDSQLNEINQALVAMNNYVLSRIKEIEAQKEEEGKALENALKEEVA